MLKFWKSFWRWIFTVPIESKFNIRARYDITTVDKAYKLHYATDIKDLYPLYGLSYEVDNAINTSIGKGYSLIFNENGIQYYYNLHTLVINAFSDDFKDATFDRIHLSESDLQ